MKLFLIRNYYTAIMANSIIEFSEEKSLGIAVLNAPII